MIIIALINKIVSSYTAAVSNLTEEEMTDINIYLNK